MSRISILRARRTQLRPLRAGIAVAAATLVTAGSVAAWIGQTTATASASAGQPHLDATTPRMLGPGPIRDRYRLGGDRILFRDNANQATRPGVISVELHRGIRPLNDARITVTYRSLDMRMPIHTLALLSHGKGGYSCKGPLLGMGGRWRISISVLPRSGPPLLLGLTDLIGL